MILADKRGEPSAETCLIFERALEGTSGAVTARSIRDWYLERKRAESAADALDAVAG